MRKLIAGSVMAALMAGSTVAQAAPVAPAAIGDIRTDSSVAENEDLFGAPMLLTLIGVVALAVVLYLVIDDGNDDEPVSV